MNLQLGFGLAGAGLGFLVGIIGGALFAVPFNIILLRSFILAAVLGGVSALLYIAIRTFLPELLDIASPSAVSHGGMVDISISGDGEAAPHDDGAPGSGDSGSRGEDRGFDPSEGAVMEEVQDGIPSATLMTGGQEGFDEDAFYAGVTHLPDIGTFSGQVAGDGAGPGPESDGYSGSETPSRSGGVAGNMDPALIAQAIRTSLRKEE